MIKPRGADTAAAALDHDAGEVNAMDSTLRAKRRSRGRKRMRGRHTKKHRADRRGAESAATRACSGRPAQAGAVVCVRVRPPGAPGGPR